MMLIVDNGISGFQGSAPLFVNVMVGLIIQGGPERMQHLQSLFQRNQWLNQISECINE